MPAAVSPDPQPQPGANDDLDDLFADLIGNDASNHAGQYNNRTSNDQPNDMDEEIKVTKKRRPIAKLDETRLLSAAGIPKLRKISKDKLKFNGKGNEFTDMARLLNTYQLWLDDLFPKAKFLDGLGMIEKLGHKKKIQMYRKEWIDEGKPKPSNYEDDIDDFVATRDAQPSERLPWDTEEHATEQPRTETEEREVAARDPLNRDVRPEGQARQTEDEEPDEDELDALLGQSIARPPSDIANTRPQEEDLEPDEDELDALMAETAQTNYEPRSLFGGPAANVASTQQPVEDFDDDEEAMAGMEW